VGEAFYCGECRIPIAELPLREPAVCPQCGQSYWYQGAAESTSVDDPVPPPPPANWAPRETSRSSALEPATEKRPAASPATEKRPAASPATEKPPSPPRELPAVAKPYAPPPPSVPAVVPRTAAVRQAASAAPRRVLQLLDWKFERYLTPWIVRATWIICVTLACLWIVVILGGLVYSWLPKPERSVSLQSAEDLLNNLENLNSLEALGQLGGDRGGGLLPGWMTSRLTSLLMAVTAICAVVLGVLWTRALLECVAVFFNMARTLTSIEDRLPPPGE
jgi:hypothetical protein